MGAARAKQNEHRPAARRTSRALAGFALVELLVVVAVMSVLVGLILPGLQAARESSRRLQCQHNLKQLGLALLHHHDLHQRFPAGGWGHEWTGVPGRGTATAQPGGWIYSILPFVEQHDLHLLGLGQVGARANHAFTQRLQTALCDFVCPTRRPCSAWGVDDSRPYLRRPRPHGDVSRAARSDYAINGGASHLVSLPGPASLAEGDRRDFWSHVTDVSRFSGISHLRTGTRFASILDGQAKTYLLAEKFVDPRHYEDGLSLGDNETMYSGYCTDLHRFAGVLESDQPLLPPWSDHGRQAGTRPGHVRFGSAHPVGFNATHCDGSVQFHAFDLDPEVHFRQGHRRDEGLALADLRLRQLADPADISPPIWWGGVAARGGSFLLSPGVARTVEWSGAAGVVCRCCGRAVQGIAGGLRNQAFHFTLSTEFLRMSVTVQYSKFEQLMTELAAGSEDAAWEIAGLYTPHIIRAVRASLPAKIRSKVDSQDLAQVVWASFLTRRSELAAIQSPAQLVALLMGVTRNKVVDATRHYIGTQARDVRREQRLDEVEHQPGGTDGRTVKKSQLAKHDPTPSQFASLRERWRLIVNELPPVEKEVVKLRVRGCTYQTISDQTPVSKSEAARIVDRVIQLVST